MTNYSNEFVAYTASERVLPIIAFKMLKFLIAREANPEIRLEEGTPPKVYNLDSRYCDKLEFSKPNSLKYCSKLPNDNRLKIEFLELEPITNNLDKAFLGNLAKVSNLDVYKNKTITLYRANRCFAVLFKTEIPDIDYIYHITIIKHKPSGKFFLVRTDKPDEIDSYFVNSWGIIPVATRYAYQWNVIFSSDAILVIPQRGVDDFLRSLSRNEYHLWFEDTRYIYQSSLLCYLEVSQAFRALPSRKWNNAVSSWVVEPRDIISFKLSGYRQHFYFNKKILFKIEKYTKELERRLGIFTRAKY